MICQSISTFCYIRSDNASKEDSQAIQCQDTPIWEGVLREIPVCQSVDKEGYFHLMQHPMCRCLVWFVLIILLTHKLISFLVINKITIIY